MNKDLAQFIQNDFPPFNKRLAEGYAYSEMPKSLTYLDDVIRSIVKAVEHETGVVYVGLERATVEQEFEELTKDSFRKVRSYNIARTDSYMVNLIFTANNRTYKKLMSIPFVSLGGQMYRYGTLYKVTPVLADRVFSVGETPGMFVRLTTVRLNFIKEAYYVQVNRVPMALGFIHSVIYKNKTSEASKNNNYGKVTPLVLYLMAKYGLGETFKRYLNVDIIYGSEETLISKGYSEEDYTFFTSTRVKPKQMKSVDHYQATDFCLLVRNEDVTDALKGLVAGVFYILDMFTQLDYRNFEDPQTWRLCLGKILFHHEVALGKLMLNVNDHLSSVDNYVDTVMLTKFNSLGLKINHMYDLLFYISANYDYYLIKNENREADCYGKELSILYYLFNDVVSQITNFTYRLKKLLKEGNGVLKDSDIENNIMNKMKTAAINNLTSTHGEISAVNYSGENLFLGFTNDLVPQEKTTKAKNRNDNVSLHKSSNFLHASASEVRTYNTATKGSPQGATRINPFLMVDETGLIIRRPEFIEALDHLQSLISRTGE